MDALQSSFLVHKQKFKVIEEEEHIFKVIHEDNYGGRGCGRVPFRGGHEQGRCKGH